MNFPIKKRINTELFIDKSEGILELVESKLVELRTCWTDKLVELQTHRMNELIKLQTRQTKLAKWGSGVRVNIQPWTRPQSLN